jgi:hypothetical protein
MPSTRGTTVRLRRTLPPVVLAAALLAAGCGPAGHSVGEVPEPDTPTPDETPIIEPVSPPANEVELPDEEPAE